MSANPLPNVEALLDLDDLSKILGMSPTSIYARRSRAPETVPPAIKIGRILRWRQLDVCAWLDQGLEAPRTARPRPRKQATPSIRLSVLSGKGRRGRPGRPALRTK